MWQEFPVLHHKFKVWYDKNPRAWWNDHNGYKIELQDCHTRKCDNGNTYLEESFRESPYYGSIANDIDWKRRVEIQAIIQKYTTHSISSTINLPEKVTKEEVGEIYLHCYKAGLKGATVYRDNCRTGVLVSKKEEFKQHDAPKRPKELDGELYLTKSGGDEFVVAVGLYENKPYEVFILKNFWFAAHGKCKIIKASKKKYDIEQDNVVIEAFNLEMTDAEETVSRLASTALRHGTDIKFLVEQLNKTPFTSLGKALAKILKKYIPDGEQSSIVFEDCETPENCQVTYEEGCIICKQCGKTKC